MKRGLIKYDSKHDTYFVQIGQQVYSLFCFQIDDNLLGKTIDFSHNEANEIERFKVS